MNTRHATLMLTLAATALAGGGLLAAGVKIDPGNMSPYSKTQVGSKLYTEPDPSASGGIRGALADLPSDLLGVIAVPQRFTDIASRDEIAGGTAAKNARNTTKEIQISAYLASVSGNSFSFRGLPPGKYDLLVVCDNAMYDGILLAREVSTLTDADVKVIKDKVAESNPFFNIKNIQRIEGVPGSYGKARALGQDMRTLPVTLQSAEVLTHIQIRSLKIYQFEQIGTAKLGPMWAVKRTRELVRQEVGPPDTKGPIPNYFCQALQGIRVSTSVKDIGTVALKQDDPLKARQDASTEIE
ncbi:MAG: hypothetical protein FWG50_10485 [Kiritimatiellaeota bacterium]|nr:hypothetical protein [Kiritimatiellota bacterium]